MGTMKKISLIFVLMLLSAVCFAQQVSFQIVQHDLSADFVTEQTYTIEDQLIEMFFENGYIVTNSPTVAVDSDFEDEKLWKSGLKDAVDGYSDYFVQIKLYYTMENTTTKGGAKLKKADWALVYAKTGKQVVQKTVKSSETVDLNEDLYLISSSIFTEIKKAIKA